MIEAPTGYTVVVSIALRNIEPPVYLPMDRVEVAAWPDNDPVFLSNDVATQERRQVQRICHMGASLLRDPFDTLKSTLFMMKHHEGKAYKP